MPGEHAGNCIGCGDAPHHGPCDPTGELYEKWLERKAMKATGVKQYRKRPVVIEAVLLDHDAAIEIAAWCGGEPVDSGLWVSTLEGTMVAQWGDWIIKGVAGEFYPCKPEIFAATYEEVRDDGRAREVRRGYEYPPFTGQDSPNIQTVTPPPWPDDVPKIGGTD